MNRKALGRGLEALIPEVGREAGAIAELPVEEIEANPDQPRTRFVDASLEELAASISEHGVLQPIVVRRLSGGGHRLIAGERRLRAARLAELECVPCIVREMDDEKALEVALVENLQREDLNPIDEAHGYETLMEMSGLSQSEIAGRVGKDRSTVANALRLLDLPLLVREMITAGELSAGHGRALLAVSPQGDLEALARKAAAKGLSVREVEALARRGRKRRKTARRRPTTDPVIRDLEERLQRLFGTLVRIERMGNEGTIRIEYYSQEDLERVLELLLSLGEARRGESAIGAGAGDVGAEGGETL